MDLRQGRVLLSLYAVDVFLDAHEHDLPRTTSSGARQRFRTALAELELNVQTQAGSPIKAKGLTKARDAKLKALLRDHMAPIARIAKLDAATNPELAPLKMPRGEPGAGKLLAQAAGMARIAEAHRNAFVAAGLRPTFIEDLNAAVDDILGTLTARTDRHGARSGATRGMRTAILACTKYKAVLDAFIQREAQGNRPLLSNWRNVKRIGNHTRRRDGTSQPFAAPPQPILDSNRLLSATV